jgi:hypothetical protein
MYCPSCRDEFREGFTSCGRCDVDLVVELPADDGSQPIPEAMPAAPTRLVEYCGFLSLDEARQSRDLLLAEAIAWEITIRPADGGGEEFWLRVDSTQTRRVATLLGDVPVVDEQDAGGFSCGECKAHVGENDDVCPGCGARFDE